MSHSKLNKELYEEIVRLKLLNPTSNPKFKLEKSPFNDDDDDDNTGATAAAASTTKDIIIVGRVYPDSDIYKDGSYQIEMKLTPTFPFDPPEVHFLTKIYHPNVDVKGEFCHQLLKKHAKWTTKISLVDVVKAVTAHIDAPDIDYSLSVELGREYMANFEEFKRKAKEFVALHALPRQ